MTSQINQTTTLNWQNICLDGGDYRNEYHSIFRDGHYALMFSDFHGWGKQVRVDDLDKMTRIKSYKFDLDEGIVNFKFPYIVSITKDNLIRIWNLNSHSTGPVHTVDPGLCGFHRGVFHENTILILSNQHESMVPNYMTPIDCVTGKFDPPMSLGKGVDRNTAFLMHENSFIISQVFGAALTIAPLDGKNEGRDIDIVKDVGAYLKGIKQKLKRTIKAPRLIR